MAAEDKLRLDKWLWQARFFKTRTLAAKTVSAEGVRIDGTRVSKPGRLVSRGNVLTFVQARRVRVIRIIELGVRRGPAVEAQALYEDLSPPEPETGDIRPKNPGYEGKGRPTKRERRNLDLNRRRTLE